MKKVLSFALAVIMIFSVMPMAFAEEGYKCDCGVTPIIYVKGRTNIYKDRFSELNDENMAETNFSGGTESIIESSANIISSLGAALLTDEWDDYCDVLFEEIRPAYDQYKLNNDGEKDEGSKTGIDPYWDADNIIKRFETENVRYGHKHNATYWAQYMQFQYDMRLDPRENAKDLKRVIDAAKEYTGHDKINIICRCEGNVIVNAYFNMYTEEAKQDIESVIMYNSIASGAEIADELYSNKVDLDAEAMNRFINGFLDTSPVLDLVKQTVNLATYAGILEGGLDWVKEIYDKISLNLMPRLIREIFGTCPGWWGMVSADAVEEAKAFILETDNADGKYDKLIQKIDEYNVYKKNVRNILEELQASGVKVYVITKYGEQIYPVIESADILGDGVVSLYKQSFNGATTAKMNTTLDEDYIKERIDLGFGEFISADKKVDASTAAFTEHTWYIRNLPHHNYPWVVETFMIDILSYDGYADVNSFGDKYTRFMNFTATDDKPHGYDNGILLPLTEGNKDDIKDTTDTSSRFVVLVKFLTALIKFFTSLLIG
ncbi:MAG: hypothetical protein IKK60_03320 [Clostridia bacterium]|nr:hypothetical protein [Clostridia bacterium]